ncbi:MAG: ABC transporter permease [Lachnospiraceae bacterium]|nr:ABC transporter permease [Lachnospiraceae bacterium]
MTQIFEYIKIALMNIKNNKGRSILTMLGIIIGISSVIMIISIGNGMRQEINSELNSIAGGQIALYTNSSVEGNDVSFTEEDFDLIKEKVDHVKGVTANYSVWGSVNVKKGHFEAVVRAGNEALQYIAATEPIVKGRYFNEVEALNGSKVCVISEASAKMLFGTTDVVGMSFETTVWNYTQELKIIGVRADNQSTLINMLGGDGGYVSAEIPMSTLASCFGFFTEEFDQFYILAEKPEYSAQVAEDSMRLMELKHKVRGENKIMMESFSDYTATYDSILNVITLFISFVAAISLMVGGIGVMNIMLVSVTERTREIGIRKALGARTGSILLQFLAESGIITLLGGLIGIVVGSGLAILACSLLGFTAHVSVVTVLIAVIFSSAVGIFFGIYPAKKAARLSPIEALRHE